MPEDREQTAEERRADEAAREDAARRGHPNESADTGADRAVTPAPSTVVDEQGEPQDVDDPNHPLHPSQAVPGGTREQNLTAEPEDESDPSDAH